VFVVLCLNWYLPQLFALCTLSLSKYLRFLYFSPVTSANFQMLFTITTCGANIYHSIFHEKKITLAAHMNTVGWMSEESWFESYKGQDFYLLFWKCPDLAGAPRLLIQWVIGLFPWRWSVWDVRPNIHLHMVPRLRMNGAIPPLPLCVPSWHAPGWHHLYSNVTDVPLGIDISIPVFNPFVKVKVKQSRYRPGVAQRVPGS